jgi:AcrR family transcriptional regulator
MRGREPERSSGLAGRRRGQSFHAVMAKAFMSKDRPAADPRARKGRSGRDRYRHGNLRAAAIAAASNLVAAGGESALSLRRVAEAVGVAHRSLYNHFVDREALVDAVAETGFEALASTLRLAATRADFVRAYVRFVLDNPNLYRVMKGQPISVINRKPGLQQAIRLSVKESARLFCDPHASAEENRRVVIKVLILLYGGISMYQEGILEVSGEDDLIAELQSMIP